MLRGRKLQQRQFFKVGSEKSGVFEAQQLLRYDQLPDGVAGTAPPAVGDDLWVSAIFWETKDGENGDGRGSRHGARCHDDNIHLFEEIVFGKEHTDRALWDRLPEVARTEVTSYWPESMVEDTPVMVAHYEDLLERKIMLNGNRFAYVTGLEYTDLQSPPTALARSELLLFPEAASGFAEPSLTSLAYNLPFKVAAACRKVMSTTHGKFSGSLRIENVSKMEWGFFINNLGFSPCTKVVDGEKAVFSGGFVSFKMFEDTERTKLFLVTKKQLRVECSG